MVKKSKYEELTKNIIGLVGGKENVSLFTHCMTRLRFNVKDKGIVETGELEKISGVLGVQWTGDQLQVIIGSAVDEVYKEICKVNEIKMQDKLNINVEEKEVRGKVKISLNSIFTAMSACIVPLIPMLIAGGMIKSVLSAIIYFGWVSSTDPTIVTFTFIADASLYFLPIALGYTCSKRFNMNPAIGMFLGGILIHPTLLGMVADKDCGSIFGIGIPAYKYTSTIFPIFLTIIVASRLERILKKYIPNSIKSIFVPTLEIVIIAPIMLCVIAPLGNYLGVYLGAGVKWLYDTFGPIGPALFAAFSPFLVMTGMHACLSTYSTNAIATTGKDIFVGAAAFIRNFNQGVAALVVAIKSKDENVRETAIGCAVSAIFAGITEPALFGINLKYRKPLYAACIGGFFGGLYAGFMGVARYTYGGSGLFGLTVFIGENPMNLVHQIIAMIIGGAVTFIVGMIITKQSDLEGGNNNGAISE